jgi:xylan 1,4-beta-xylosidase
MEIPANMLRQGAPLILAVAPLLAFFPTGAAAQTRAINVDAAAVTGVIRSLQGLDNGPAKPWEPKPAAGAATAGPATLIAQYRELLIDNVRTHDSGADINAWLPTTSGDKESIFPKWDADPFAPTSYDFRRSDEVVHSILAAGADVYFRLGSGHDPRPPADFDKYAEICKHVVMHFNGGWSKGYHHNIRYWEFWNEPNLAMDWMVAGAPDPKVWLATEWLGSPEQFFRLYATVARALLAYDPSLKIGTGSIAEGGRRSAYREQLMEYCAKNNVPLDFFSFHHYHENSSDPYDMVRIAREIRLLLNAYGLRHTEIHSGEWNLSIRDQEPQKQNSAAAAAFTATVLVYLQDAPIELSHYYSGIAGDMGLWESDGSPRKKAQAFKAAGMMLDTPQRIEATGADTVGYAVLAGRSRNARKVQVLISNYEMGPVAPEPLPTLPGVPGVETYTPKADKIRYVDNQRYNLTVKNLPWGNGEFSVKRYRVTKKDNFTLSGAVAAKGGSLTISNELAAPGVELIVLEAQ